MGFVLFKRKRWKQAEKFVRMATELEPEKKQWHYRLGLALEHLRKWAAALVAYDTALSLDDTRAEWHYHRGICLLALKRWADAEAALRAAVDRDDCVAKYHGRLAEALRAQHKQWQAIQALERSTELDRSHAEWFASLADARERMGRFGDAAAAYRHAITIKPAVASWHYRLGHVLEQDGRMDEASSSYQLALELEDSPELKRFKVGAWHQKRGLWPAAASTYAAECEVNPTDAELHHRLGLAHDRCYRWNDAVAAYRRAVDLDDRHADWFGDLGCALERLGDADSASAAFGTAATLAPASQAPYWCYRQGCALERGERYAEACEAFLNPRAMSVPSRPRWPRSVASILGALSHDASRPELHYELGHAYERAEDWIGAVEAYRDAVARKNKHSPGWYHRLGYCLTKVGRHREACRAFRSTRILQRHYPVPSPQYNKESGFRTAAHYTEYIETLPISDKHILYESFHGRSMSCNPYAVFLEALGRPELSGWTHVWALQDTSKVDPWLRTQRNVIFVARESDLYLRYLATAKYLVNNTSFLPYFIRRPEQIYLNTWHGTPLKTLGKDVKGSFWDWGNIARNFLHATHIISPNAHTTRVLMEGFGVASSCRAVVAETGYPRIDLTLNLPDEEKQSLRRELGVPDGKKVVLYAPTYRGTVQGATFDRTQLVLDIEALTRLDAHVLFRGHYFVEHQLASSRVKAALVPERIDTNHLLAIVDVLITDYSSVAVDFLVTGKPIVWHVSDLEEYMAERGLSVSMDQLPGEKSFDRDQLCDATRRCLDAPSPCADEAYAAARTRFCPNEDGRSAARVVDMLVFDRLDGVAVRPPDGRISMLFFAGQFMPTGITVAFRNLVSRLDVERYSVSVAVEPHQVGASPERVRQVRDLEPRLQVLPRVGRMDATMEERWVINKFSAQNDLTTPAMWQVYKKAFRREAQRLFGSGHFDVLIQFDSYGHFWASVFAFAALDGTPRRVMYHHNDMYAEMSTKYPSLPGTFLLSRHYDALISVSRNTRDLNRRNLSDRYGLEPSRFEYCDNILNPAHILELAAEPLGDSAETALLERPGPKFVTVGRLSPEKGHSRLIDAFARIRRTSTNAELFVIGDGPLKNDLSRQVARLRLGDAVHLLGARTNPFPLVNRADCFVLASLYEGQGLVLLEAMVLGKPIISTDFPSARDVLEGGRGLIVESSLEGLVRGMSLFLEGQLVAKPFDSVAYEQRAMHMFLEKVVGVRSQDDRCRRPPAAALG